MREEPQKGPDRLVQVQSGQDKRLPSVAIAERLQLIKHFSRRGKSHHYHDILVVERDENLLWPLYDQTLIGLSDLLRIVVDHSMDGNSVLLELVLHLGREHGRAEQNCLLPADGRAAGHAARLTP